ncbi:uncharacterized protein LOC115883482 [Sitophilus oryzae]|uniref:Uncharacterized protein LOC115883482 n=1 Tax=Sitophilus oryzae TaxID=7048 RepID=A0A6J2Y362_SITOR|nr:uncharacterized protein LOC115883482 [Sitophilus oryzae]
MAFSKASRFHEQITCTPSPMDYIIPSNFDIVVTKKHISWLKNNPNLGFGDFLKFYNKDLKTLSEKIYHQECSSDSGDTYIVKKKTNTVSNRRIKMAESKAPSFMNRKKIVHCCTSEKPAVNKFQKNSRFSSKRKSICPTQKSIKSANKTSENQLPLEKHSSTSSLNYNADSEGSKSEAKPLSENCNQRKGTFIITKNDDHIESVPKLADKTESLNNELEQASTYSITSSLEIEEMLTKNLFYNESMLEEELKMQLNIYLEAEQAQSSDIEEWFEKSRSEDNEKILNFNALEQHLEETNSVSAENETEFYMSETFIDDDYDSYLNMEKGGERGGIDNESFFELYQSIIEKYTNEVLPAQTEDQGNYQKLALSMEGQKQENSFLATFDMLFGECKNGRRLRTEMEKVVKNAISELKVQFKKEIYRNTEDKLHGLISEIVLLSREADRSTEDMCDVASNTLIAKLESLMN